VSGTTFGSILECQGPKFIINGNTQECMTIKELFEGPVGDYCIARNTIKCLFYITNYNSFALSPQNGVFNISKNDKYIQAGYEIKVLNL